MDTTTMVAANNTNTNTNTDTQTQTQTQKQNNVGVIRSIFILLSDVLRSITIGLVLSPAALTLPFVWLTGSSACWRC